MADERKPRKGCGCILATVLLLGFLVGLGAILLALIVRNVDEVEDAAEHGSEARVETQAPMTKPPEGGQETDVRDLTDVPPPADELVVEEEETTPITQDVKEPYDAPAELTNPEPPQDTAPAPSP